AAAPGHQRRDSARQADERVRADVERDAEALARRLDEWLVQRVRRRERRAVHEKIEAAELTIERSAQRRNLFVARDVAWQDQRVLEALRQLADVLLEPRARIGQRKARARRG